MTMRHVVFTTMSVEKQRIIKNNCTKVGVSLLEASFECLKSRITFSSNTCWQVIYYQVSHYCNPSTIV